MPNRIAVVILNWNTKDFLQKFLPSVIKFSSDVADIIVADNASSDDSVQFLKNNFPSVSVIVNPNNNGYAGGYNEALKHINAEFYLLLNSDVEVSENWLQPLITLMDSDKNIAACQPKLISYYEKNKFEYAGAAGGFIDKYGYPFCRGRIFNSIENDIHQYDDAVEVFWASGACMLIRSDIFHQMNGFDPVFFAHMEEIDLCWRIILSGKKIYYCPHSVVYHVGGGTLPKSSPRKTFLNFRNNLLMLHKNLPEQKRKKILRARWFLDTIASIRFLSAGNFDDYRAVWKARKEFHLLKSRYSSRIQGFENDNTITSFFTFPKSILAYYYLYGRKKFSSLKWNPGRQK